MFRILVSAGVLAVSMGAADAAPKCPAGSIYRVTKKFCVEKSVAVRDGIITRSDRVAKARAASQRTSSPNTPSQDRVRFAAAPIQDAAPHDQGARAHQTPVQAPAESRTGATGSPYGILLDPWRVGDFVAPLQTRFSLQLATQN